MQREKVEGEATVITVGIRWLNCILPASKEPPLAPALDTSQLQNPAKTLTSVIPRRGEAWLPNNCLDTAVLIWSLNILLTHSGIEP